MIVFFRGRRVPIILVVVISTRCFLTVTGFKNRKRKVLSAYWRETGAFLMSENCKFDNVTKLIRILVRFFEKNVIIPVIFECPLFWLGLFNKKYRGVKFLVFLQYGLLMY